MKSNMKGPTESCHMHQKCCERLYFFWESDKKLLACLLTLLSLRGKPPKPYWSIQEYFSFFCLRKPSETFLENSTAKQEIMDIQLDLPKRIVPGTVLSHSRCSSLGIVLSCLGFSMYLLDPLIPHLMGWLLCFQSSNMESATSLYLVLLPFRIDPVVPGFSTDYFFSKTKCTVRNQYQSDM